MISTFIRADRLRLAMLFRSTEEDRYYLNGVAIQPNGAGVRVCATDGFRVALFQDDAGFTDTPMIVPVPKVVCDLIKQTKHRDQTWFAIMQGNGLRREARLFYDGEAGLGELAQVQEAMEDISSHGVLWAGPVELIDGTFPDIDSIMPEQRANNGVAATFHSKYLKDFGAVAGDLAREASGPVRVYPAADQAALVDCGRPDFVGVIMPMRQQELALEMVTDHVLPPIWARPTA